ncbi:MAG: hypothetical protein LDLANPLL_01248 [Turneriella sp.]|nr:hypothetical protein [Turneriella sp.]
MEPEQKKVSERIEDFLASGIAELWDEIDKKSEASAKAEDKDAKATILKYAEKLARILKGESG